MRRQATFLACLIAALVTLAPAAFAGDAQPPQAADDDVLSFRSPRAAVVGNPKGDVTVVEFFDYNCGYCRRALPSMLKLIRGDKDVRVVLVELPIFGADSEAAAKIALAAKSQGKYFELHQRLFGEKGKADRAKAIRIAKSLRLDMRKLEQDMEGPEVSEALAEGSMLAQRLGILGTPTYYIAGKLLPGAPEDLHAQLTRSVANARLSPEGTGSAVGPP